MRTENARVHRTKSVWHKFKLMTFPCMYSLYREWRRCQQHESTTCFKCIVFAAVSILILFICSSSQWAGLFRAQKVDAKASKLQVLATAGFFNASVLGSRTQRAASGLRDEQAYKRQNTLSEFQLDVAVTASPRIALSFASGPQDTLASRLKTPPKSASLPVYKVAYCIFKSRPFTRP
jgi:hypothetical protein